MRAVSLIEPLEDRIAPAGVTVAPNGKSASYTDSNGDLVQVTTSRGLFVASDFTLDSNNQLTQLALAGSAFNGANIAFSVTPKSTGGLNTVNVGYISAQGVNLGSVTIPGDLGRIQVGGGPTSTALAKLNVASLGVQGVATQDGITNASTVSMITGTAGSINVSGNVDGTISMVDYNGKIASGNIQQLNINGSLDGNTSGGAGEILFTGTLGTAVIGGGIEGGSADNSGTIQGTYAEFSKIGTITVKGSVPDDPNPSPVSSIPGTSILGGSGMFSGGILAVTVGTVNIGGDVTGGTGLVSGDIQGGLSLGKVTVGGSLIGGNFTSGTPTQADNAGTIFGGAIGTVTIGRNISGGSGLNSGQVYSTGTIGSVTVMGDLLGGTAGQGTTAGDAGSIHAQAIGNVVIKGAMTGGSIVSADPNQTGMGDGVISSATNINSVVINGNLTGGSGSGSGVIDTTGGTIKSLFIGGSLNGGAGASSGSVNVAGSIGKLNIAQNLMGGSGANSGSIVSKTASSLVLGGNLIGGSANDSGEIMISGLLSSLSINGAQGIAGGSNTSSTLLSDTGYVQAGGIGTLTVKNAVTAGTTTTADLLANSGAIRSTAAIDSITVGSLVGNSGASAIISAVGQANLPANAKTDVAIGKVTVVGNTTYGDILAGYNSDTANSMFGTGVNADAQIGTVTIGGTLQTTNIIAGVGPGMSGFGTSGSAALSGQGVTDMPSIISKISSIVIKGNVIADSTPSESYGIAAQYIASAKVNGKTLPLTAGADNDTFANNTDLPLPTGTSTADDDVVLYEV